MAKKQVERRPRFRNNVSLRLTDEEKHVYDEIAESKGMTTNAYLRLRLHELHEEIFNKHKEFLKQDS